MVYKYLYLYLYLVLVINSTCRPLIGSHLFEKSQTHSWSKQLQSSIFLLWYYFTTNQRDERKTLCAVGGFIEKKSIIFTCLSVKYSLWSDVLPKISTEEWPVISLSTTRWSQELQPGHFPTGPFRTSQGQGKKYYQKNCAEP